MKSVAGWPTLIAALITSAGATAVGAPATGVVRCGAAPARPASAPFPLPPRPGKSTVP